MAPTTRRGPPYYTCSTCRETFPTIGAMRSHKNEHVHDGTSPRRKIVNFTLSEKMLARVDAAIIDQGFSTRSELLAHAVRMYIETIAPIEQAYREATEEGE